MYFAVLLLVTLALNLKSAAALCGKPITLLDSLNYTGLKTLDQPLSSYKDPATRLNHAVLAVSSEHIYYYFAVSDDGIVVHRTSFSISGPSYKGIIRGAGNGKNLYLAMASCREDNQRAGVDFTESADGGATWKPVLHIATPSYGAYLTDLLCVPETGRLYLFYVNVYSGSVRMVTRPKDSIVFGTEIVVTKGWSVALRMCAKAAYDSDSGVLHLVFISGNTCVLYTSSEDGGLTWLQARCITQNFATQITNSAASGDGRIFFTALAWYEDPASLLASQDNGHNFVKPSHYPRNGHGAWAPMGWPYAGPLNDRCSPSFTLQTRQNTTIGT